MGLRFEVGESRFEEYGENIFERRRNRDNRHEFDSDEESNYSSESAYSEFWMSQGLLKNPECERDTECDDGTFDSPNMPGPTDPIGSTYGSPQRTEDDRCHGTINEQDAVRQPDQSKPIPPQRSFLDGNEEWDKYLPEILRSANDLSNDEILNNIKLVERALRKKKLDLDY